MGSITVLPSLQGDAYMTHGKGRLWGPNRVGLSVYLQQSVPCRYAVLASNGLEWMMGCATGATGTSAS
eukprot:54332-Eustigmatos_ZCMA.PRE.1